MFLLSRFSVLISYNMWSSNHFSTSSCFPCFSGSRFFRVRVHGPGPGSRVRVQGPGPRSKVRVQGPGPGSRVRVQVLEVACLVSIMSCALFIMHYALRTFDYSAYISLYSVYFSLCGA